MAMTNNQMELNRSGAMKRRDNRGQRKVGSAMAGPARVPSAPRLFRIRPNQSFFLDSIGALGTARPTFRRLQG